MGASFFQDRVGYKFHSKVLPAFEICLSGQSPLLLDWLKEKLFPPFTTGEYVNPAIELI